MHEDLGWAILTGLIVGAGTFLAVLLICIAVALYRTIRKAWNGDYNLG